MREVPIRLHHSGTHITLANCRSIATITVAMVMPRRLSSGKFE